MSAGSAPAPAGVGALETPAGFWRRYAAWSLDWLLLAPCLALALSPSAARAWQLLLAVNAVVQDWVYARIVAADGAFPSPVTMTFELLADARAMGALQLAVGRAYAALGLLLAGVVALAALYFIAFEASPWRATPGKRLLGLRVAALDGGRPGLLRVVLRFGAGGLSWLALNLGHAMVGWRRDRRALHDLIAGTQVLARGALPRWARWWLIAQAALLLAVMLAYLARLFWLLWQLATL